MDKQDILSIIEEEVLTVHAIEEDYIHTSNGLLNSKYLEKRKELFFDKNISYIIDDVVKVKQHFPENDVSTVTMSIDMVVMKREDLDKILKYIEENE